MNAQATTYDAATRKTTRDRSVNGWRIDGEQLLAHGKQAAFAKWGAEWDWNELTNGPTPQGIYEAQDGDYVVVNGEGVRSHVQTTGEIEVYFSYGMTWIPLVLDIADVLDCITYLDDDQLNLADNIRVFGSRLESNFSGAWHKITGN